MTTQTEGIKDPSWFENTSTSISVTTSERLLISSVSKSSLIRILSYLTLGFYCISPFVTELDSLDVISFDRVGSFRDCTWDWNLCFDCWAQSRGDWCLSRLALRLVRRRIYRWQLPSVYNLTWCVVSSRILSFSSRSPNPWALASKRTSLPSFC